jgi:ABC-2 type transport system ATP-binding protein
MSKIAIELKKVSKHYREGITRKRIEAINDVSLTVNEGEVFAFLGLNGAGKTTTIKLLLDHARPTSGSAQIFGLDAREPRARVKVGYLPDLPNFYRFLNAWELLDYCGKLFGLGRSERRERSRRLLERVGILDRADEALKGYSRGMLQRLGLAQALINDPALVILDEPLGGLDPMGRAELRSIIAGLRDEGKTVFFSSHILDDAQRIADRVGIIHKGRLVATGSLAELLKSSPGWEVEVIPNGGFDFDAFAAGRSLKYERLPGCINVILPDDLLLADFHRLAADGSLKIQSLVKGRLSLEEAFFEELGKWQH